MTASSAFWHPFADMGTVRDAELVIDRGEDVWIWDTDGRRYFDATASLWYANIGHGRREIAEAVAAQMGRIEAYNHFGDFSSAPANELAARLADHAPMDGAKVFFTSGGSDSVDTAFKLARRYWSVIGEPDRTHVISRQQSYHGTHGLGTSIAGIPANREGWGPLLEDASVIPHSSAEALADTIARQGAGRVAAFFMEPVVGAGGVFPPPDGYVEAVAEICRETGVLLICDSVICAFGRLGTWFGIERWPGVAPDLITFAKGVTSGYLPLGGVVASGRIAEPFWAQPGSPILRQGVTYAGHASCCAAGLANLDILENEGLMTRGQELEGALYDALNAHAGHPAVDHVRGGMGMMAALELAPDVMAANPKAAPALVKSVREAGVIVRPIVSCIVCSPPLTSTQEHLDLLSEAVGAGLDALVGA